jgi:hypothetical protein
MTRRLGYGGGRLPAADVLRTQSVLSSRGRRSVLHAASISSSFPVVTRRRAAASSAPP